MDGGSGKVTEFRAAQYVRMSTEHQQYSTHNQADKIREYADKRGIEIVKTYADDGKSGLSYGFCSLSASPMMSPKRLAEIGPLRASGDGGNLIGEEAAERRTRSSSLMKCLLRPEELKRIFRASR